MSSTFLTSLFWAAVLAVIVAQVMILRSTARAWRGAGTAAPFTEKLFAVGPALVLVAVLWLSWRAAMAPPVIHVEFVPGIQGITL